MATGTVFRLTRPAAPVCATCLPGPLHCWISARLMSARGHSLQVRPRPLVHKCPLCINTDRKFWALGFVAMCQEATYAAQQRTLLFDDLIGHREQRWWNFKAERISRLQINNELEFGRLLDR
jgi:hypothetical protein